jgi:hypothetical protein
LFSEGAHSDDNELSSLIAYIIKWYIVGFGSGLREPLAVVSNRPGESMPTGLIWDAGYGFGVFAIAFLVKLYSDGAGG